MAQYIVTANKLNKRSVVPANLPDSRSIVGVVNKDYTFEGREADPNDVPNNALGKWYQDTDGYFYWGGAVMLKSDTPAAAANGMSSSAADTLFLTTEKVKAAAGAFTINAQKFLPYIIDTCAKYFINSLIRQLCFLAQTGHESGGLFYTEELASGQDYEGRRDLGNVNPGDGVRYKGRGLIQVTGRGNYDWISKNLDVDFVGSPEMLGGKNVNSCTPDQLKYAALSAGWYWNNHALNAVADSIDIEQPIDEGTNLDQFKLITRRINGGYNGLNDRISRYKAGVQFFK
jgi:putative chitinase